MRRITKWGIWIAVFAGLYYIAGFHFIYFGGWTVKKLKKKNLTFSRTFFSMELKSIAMVLDDDVLREAGIADLMVEMGMLDEERKKVLLREYEEYED